MTHTQGKLTATVFDEGFFSIEDDSGDPIGEVYGGANAFRIVACWNTCDGISTEHLEGGIAGVLTRVRKGVRMAEHGLGMGRSMTTTLTDQELEDIYELHANEDIDGWVYDHDAIARAVIAAHEAKLLAGAEMPHHPEPHTYRWSRLEEETANPARVLEWMRTPNRKPAQTAFTAGPERQAAYWIEIAQGESRPQAVRAAALEEAITAIEIANADRLIHVPDCVDIIEALKGKV